MQVPHRGVRAAEPAQQRQQSTRARAKRVDSVAVELAKESPADGQQRGHRPPGGK